MGILIGWTNFVVPRLFPPTPKEAVQDVEAPDQAQDAPNDPNADDPQAEAPPDAAPPADEPVADKGAAAPGKTPADGEIKAAQADAAQPRQHPHREVTLGSLDPESGYFMEVTLTTTGAAVKKIALNDSRYRELTDRTAPLKVVGNNPGSGELTLETTLTDPEAEKKLGVLDRLEWEVVPGSESPSGVTFRIQSADGRFELRKRYELTRVPPEKRQEEGIRDRLTEPYLVHFEFSIVNRAEQAETVRYVMQGPVGLPLENEEHTSKYRDVRVGFLEESGDVTNASKTAADIVEAANSGEVEEWKKALQYIGVDVQYFAALIVPRGNQIQEPYISEAVPTVVEEAAEEQFSDISVQLTSVPIELAPGAEVMHVYDLYAGPKRQELLVAFGAGEIVDYGWFSAVSQGMLWLLNTLHDWHVPYGIAIIMLTVLVRGCLFPISKKQAVGAKKMKELQPKIAELRKKYANDKEKMAKAQMELFSKHNYNPFAGCLPIFLQLPIFIGLYRALSSAVDLRMASFLWIDNLAAPDALFRMPFSLPFLGADFNLLPLLTVGLFIVQQKMFMPPPTDKEQELQQKMMNYMMIFFGFMFYHVPAGLCVYFIASSLWGIGERKLLDWSKNEAPLPEADVEAAEKKTDKQGPAEKPAKTGFWARMVQQIEATAKKMEAEQQAMSSRGGSDQRKRKKSRPRR